MKSRLRIVAMIAVFAAGSACASAGGGTAGGNAVTSPKPVTPSSPTFEFTRGTDIPSGTVTYQVWIDTFGKPDMRTLSFSGPTTPAYEEAIKRWLSIATFQPATQAGEPTRGLYENHTTFTRRRR